MTASWTNVSSATIVDLGAVIAELTGGNTVLNADDGAGAVGSTITVPNSALGPDGVPSPGESFTQAFDIGLAV